MKTNPTILSLFFLASLGTSVATGHAGHSRHSKDSVKIIRDDYGVPHVYAANVKPLFYGVGYAQAQDRLWQADIHRRLGTGTLAEFFGADSVSGDVFARKVFGPSERRAALLDTLSPEGQAILQAYADGMNAWIEEATTSGQLPVEYSAQGLTVRPWTVDDTVATFMLLASQFGWFGSDELDNAAQLQELIAIHGPDVGVAVFADTHWLDDPDAPTSVPDSGPGDAHHARANRGKKWSWPRRQGKAGFDRALRGWKNNLRKARIGEAPASNAVVLGPKLTTDRRPLLLGGPQMGYSSPQINHEIGIHGAGFDVTGTQIAGLPGVQIGVGDKYAWTLTSGVTDNSDIYQEVQTVDGYLYNGESLGYHCRDESINVRGANPRQISVCESIHGPVIAELPGVAFTLKNATNGEELRSWEAWLNIGRARSIDEFDKALSAIAYNFNVLYGDARGNIAYWHIGKVPVRAEGDNPWLPHDGTGGAEWQGFVQWKDMPHVRNPARGWLASWNNKPRAGWENSVAGFGTFGPVHRVNTLIELLKDLTPRSADLATLADINETAGTTADTPSGSARTVFVPTLLDELTARLDPSLHDHPTYGPVIEILRNWDWLQINTGQDGLYDQPAVTVFNTWWQNLVAQVFDDDLGTTGHPNVVANLIARMLDDDPAVPLLHDYLDGDLIGEAVSRAFVKTVDEYAKTDPNPAEWLQPAASITWSAVGAVAAPDTVWMNRGTYNQLVHLGNGRKLFAKNVVAPGQSGDPYSPHFADQLALYATWRYKPMILDRRGLRGHTEEVIRLRMP